MNTTNMQGIKETPREKILSLEEALRKVDNAGFKTSHSLSVAARVINDIAEGKCGGKTPTEYAKDALSIPDLANTTAFRAAKISRQGD